MGVALPRSEALTDAILLALEYGRWLTSPEIAATIGEYDHADVFKCDGRHDKDEYWIAGRLCWRRLSCDPTENRAWRIHVYRYTVTSQETNPQLRRLQKAGKVQRRDVRGAVQWRKAGRWRLTKAEELEAMFALPDAVKETR